jgi:hypothetical protein
VPTNTLVHKKKTHQKDKRKKKSINRFVLNSWHEINVIFKSEHVKPLICQTSSALFCYFHTQMYVLSGQSIRSMKMQLWTFLDHKGWALSCLSYIKNFKIKTVNFHSYEKLKRATSKHKIYCIMIYVLWTTHKKNSPKKPRNIIIFFFISHSFYTHRSRIFL